MIELGKGTIVISKYMKLFFVDFVIGDHDGKHKLFSLSYDPYGNKVYMNLLQDEIVFEGNKVYRNGEMIYG